MKDAGHDRNGDPHDYGTETGKPTLPRVHGPGPQCSGGAAIDHDETGVCDHGPAAPQQAAPVDSFTEAVIRRFALLAGAAAIENLPQDYECDPGRGDAVKLLRRMAEHRTPAEQPTGLTWEARAEHAVSLYALTAIERDDALAEVKRLRCMYDAAEERTDDLIREREELIEQRDRLAELEATTLRAAADRITALGRARGWSIWAADFIHPDREFIDPGVPAVKAQPYGDPNAYGPTGLRCGCGRAAHSNLTTCRPDSPEDPHDSPLHHDYRLSHDLPEPSTWVGATELVSERKVAAVAATGIVGYRQNQGRLLHCLEHKPAPASRYGDFHEVTADDLDNGGVCAHPKCGRDLLAAFGRRGGSR
ncbi:hypothetical protein [Streptomyces sp. C10-9-1]|uniref:hypothetical protein n=1 Tax=Streptomyces sp. C10-9-1 TaxID=1859285 RepID=UPI003F4A30E5